MILTIEGDREQVRDACKMLYRLLHRINNKTTFRRAVSKAGSRQGLIVARRRLMRTAYELLRNKPDHLQLFNSLAHALGGSQPITDDLIENAVLVLINEGVPPKSPIISLGTSAHLDLRSERHQPSCE